MVIDIQRYFQETELFFTAELCSKIIRSMQLDGSVTLRTKEGRCARTNGLYALLDELCNFWQWDPSKITLETCNYLESHEKYNIVHGMFDYMSLEIADRIKNIQPRPWNKEKVYGMFIGRANATRIRGVHFHQQYEFKHLGLTSFHHDMSYHVDKMTMLDYLMQSNQPFDQAISIKPYSDIGHLMTPPIAQPQSIIGWESVYEKIGIELVFQTDPVETCIQFGEKLIRPMLYKRPFMIVAGRNYIKNINTCYQNLQAYSNDPETTELIEHFKHNMKPFKFFGNVLDLDYDNGEGIYRVDHLFHILGDLIRSEKIYTILEDCQEDIEHNYQAVIEMSQMLAEISKKQTQFFNYADWDR